tara:strand:- start:288 stop:647 length:360 start_codon:yes stop_codon:yes gene_type:complete
MSWQDILKNVEIDLNEACCSQLRNSYSHILEGLADYYEEKGIKTGIRNIAQERANAPCETIKEELEGYLAMKGQKGSNVPNWVFYQINEALDEYIDCGNENEYLSELNDIEPQVITELD